MIRRIEFTPDATIEAAERGDRITHIKSAFFYERLAEAGLVGFVGLPPEWWGVLIRLLLESEDLHARALGEAIRNGLNEARKP